MFLKPIEALSCVPLACLTFLSYVLSQEDMLRIERMLREEGCIHVVQAGGTEVRPQYPWKKLGVVPYTPVTPALWGNHIRSWGGSICLCNPRTIGGISG